MAAQASDGYIALIQAILWPADWLASLTVGTPNPRKEPRRIVVPAPPAPPAPYEPTVDEVCAALRWLRDWRYAINQQWLASGKPADLKRLLEALDNKANGVADLLGAMWQEKEQPRWKQKAS